MAKHKTYWRYATLTIPAGTIIHKAADWSETRLIIPLTARAQLLVDRKNEPKHGARWSFGFCNYNYTLPLDAPGITAADERFIGK